MDSHPLPYQMYYQEAGLEVELPTGTSWKVMTCQVWLSVLLHNGHFVKYFFDWVMNLSCFGCSVIILRIRQEHMPHPVGVMCVSAMCERMHYMFGIHMWWLCLNNLHNVMWVEAEGMVWCFTNLLGERSQYFFSEPPLVRSCCILCRSTSQRHLCCYVWQNWRIKCNHYYKQWKVGFLSSTERYRYWSSTAGRLLA